MKEENIPVIVGVGQLVERDVAVEEATEPLAMLAAMARRCAEDSGAGSAALREIDAMGIVQAVLWSPQNGPRLLAERVGARARREVVTAVGGEAALALLNDMAQQIVEGRSQVALLAGCNNFKTIKRSYKEGVQLGWTVGGTGTPEIFGESLAGQTELEAAYGLASPPFVYPIFENAMRVRRDLDLDTHRQRMGELMSPFTEVAAKNPYAWYPIARSAEELTQASPRNRMISYPYTKYLNAVLETDQAAAVLLMSVAKARSLGVPEDRWVYWWGGAKCQEEAWWASERPDFGQCPALETSVDTALDRSGVTLDDIDCFDFYSCFPVAVSMACEMLGLAEDDARGLTLTGGLPYAGGPGNNYPTHAVAAMVDRLRGRSDAKAMTTGNGWYLTKHSASVFSTSPREDAYASTAGAVEPRAEDGFDMKPVPVLEEANGSAVVETYTATFDRELAPERGVIVARLDSGERCLANTPSDPDGLRELLQSEMIGRRGTVTHREGRNRFEPH